MADRELRRMHRAELIEIIYALKQSEDQLKAQNAALTAQLQDRQLRLESAGSIAQAALDVVFLIKLSVDVRMLCPEAGELHQFRRDAAVLGGRGDGSRHSDPSFLILHAILPHKTCICKGKMRIFCVENERKQIAICKNGICGRRRKKKENVKNRQKFWLQTENACDIIKRTNHG